MSPMGAGVDLVALGSAVREEVADVDVFDDGKESGGDALTSPNWPVLCSSELIAVGHPLPSVEDGFRRADLGGVENRQGVPLYSFKQYMDWVETNFRFDTRRFRVSSDASRGGKNLGGERTMEQALERMWRHLPNRPKQWLLSRRGYT